ncbi:ethanolamine kinase 1-like [Lineus longissimus]|uniref:ethanolamine kinase 1-like n=1 Tax=Lineus longissimus TaxID=88925 RepID=UPI002B4E5072
MSSERMTPLHVDVEVDSANYEEGFRQILGIIRPGWKGEDIKFKRIQQGMLNILVICYITEEPDDSAMLLRVIGALFAGHRDREREIAAVKLSGELDLGPKFYCSFKNGYGTGFFPGTTYGWDDDSLNAFRDDRMGRAVAKLLAKFHCKKTLAKSRESKMGKGIDIIAVAKDEMEKHWSKPMKNKELTEYFYEGLPSKEELLVEIDRLAVIRDEMNVEARMLHGDPNPTNIIFNEKTGKMVLVDYEFSGIGNPLLDLTWYLNFAAIGLYRADEDDEYHFGPEYVKSYVRAYLTELKRLDGEDPPTEREFERLYVMLLRFYMIFSLTISMFALPFLNSSLDRVPDPKQLMSSYRGRLLYYLKHKDRVFSMPTPQV